jgi:hypothetical protein
VRRSVTWRESGKIENFGRKRMCNYNKKQVVQERRQTERNCSADSTDSRREDFKKREKTEGPLHCTRMSPAGE